MPIPTRDQLYRANEGSSYESDREAPLPPLLIDRAINWLILILLTLGAIGTIWMLIRFALHLASGEM